MAKRRTDGEGSLYFSHAEDTWIAEVTLPDGRRKKKRNKNKRVVRDWLLEKRKALKDNRPMPDEKITLDAWLDRFLNEVASHTLRPKTLSDYRWITDKHIKPEIGRIRLANLKPQHLTGLYTKKRDEGLSRRTIQYIHAVTRRALNEAVKWELIYRNPCDAVSPPRPHKKTFKTFNTKQIKKFLGAVEDHRWKPIYYLAFAGLRRGEILGLHFEDFDPVNGTVTIRHTVSAIRGQTILGEPKTEQAKRTITLPEFIIDVLNEYQMLTDGVEGLMFTTSSGKPVSPRNLVRHFKQVLEEEGLPEIRFHDLRHTTATLLLKQNVHPKVVQEMLGHSTISVTLDLYSHTVPGMQEKAAKELDGLLS